MVSAWRNFKNIFSRPLFTIIFRPEMLKFRPYSILTRETMHTLVLWLEFHPYSILAREIMVGFVIQFAINGIFSGNHILYSFQRLRTMHPQIFVLFKKNYMHSNYQFFQLIANGPDGVAGVAVQKAVAVEANLDRDLNQQQKLMAVLVLDQVTIRDIATPTTVLVSSFLMFFNSVLR